MASYKDLLKKISRNLLRIAGYNKHEGIENLLESPDKPELPQNVIDKKIEQIRTAARLEFLAEKITDYREKLQEAAIFRLLRQHKKVEGRTTREKRYAGFETYTYLSSGIIRIFLNLVGAALYKAEDEKVKVKEGQQIPIRCQTWAANIISAAWLDRIRSIYDLHEYGEQTYQLVLDIGDIFRERLLSHPTEPETITMAIPEPLDIKAKVRSNLPQILRDGAKESVFYEKQESMKPKTPSANQTKEYVLNRVYAPVLGISYRPRWPRACEFSIDDLLGLLDASKRPEIKRRLLNKQHPSKKIDDHPKFNKF